MAKQILQLGMGDALDDWLIEKIQLLRTGSVVASGIKRVEQVIYYTLHEVFSNSLKFDVSQNIEAVLLKYVYSFS